MKKKTLGHMSRYLFRNTVFACLLAVTVCIGVFTLYSHDRMAKISSQSLKDEVNYVAKGVELWGIHFLEDLPKGQTRITWIDQQGNVLYDSEAPAESLENHRERQEVRQAMEQGWGESVRYSKTLAERSTNLALFLPDGTVIRLSVAGATVLSVLGQMALPIVLILAIATLCAVALGYRTSRKIVKPINELDVQNPEGNAVYEELQPLVHRICAQNEELHQQIQTQQAEHKAQDRFRREFTANVSHELKTPLTSISGFAEIIRDGLVQPQDISHFADNICKESQRLIVLVGDIIKISQMDDMEVPVQKERLNLLELCRDVVDHLRPAADKRGVRLYLEGTPEMIVGAWQIADEMIYNLCDNAIKYNKPGGEVRLSVERRENGSAVCVRDTGIGIPKEHQSRVFERFYRVDKSHSKEIGGTGLGLSIVKHGAIYHNATLSLESKLGEGTAITVVFPRALEGAGM